MRVAIGPLIASAETVEGEPITVGEWQIEPVARTISIVVHKEGMPAGAGFALTRPLAVKVTGRGESRRLRIVDVTRIARGVVRAGMSLAARLEAESARKSAGKRGG